MAIAHLLSGQVARLLPLGDKLPQTPTTALFKDERLEVIHIVMAAGKRMPDHAVDGPLTLQCIEGEIDFGVGAGHTILRTGDLVYLAGGLVHGFTAVKNSSLLLTIVLLEPPGPAGERRMQHDNDVKTPE